VTWSKTNVTLMYLVNLVGLVFLFYYIWNAIPWDGERTVMLKQGRFVQDKVIEIESLIGDRTPVPERTDPLPDELKPIDIPLIEGTNGDHL